MRNQPTEVVNDHDRGARYRNVAADVSIGAVALAFVLFVSRFQGDDWIFTSPACGLIAVVSGILGLVRARQAGGGKAKALIGMVLGLFVLLVGVGFLLLAWAWSHSDWQF